MTLSKEIKTRMVILRKVKKKTIKTLIKMLVMVNQLLLQELELPVLRVSNIKMMETRSVQRC
jgi:hypothetical protein